LGLREPDGPGDSAGANGGTTTFKYDPFGRRIHKSGPLGTTNHLYDGRDLVEEVDSSGNIVARYTQSPSLDQPLAELRSGTTSYYEQDGIGSVSALSNSAGVLSNTYTYDAFGQLSASSGTLTNPFQYTGREFDTETSLYYYRARYYDAKAGRFLGEDPMGDINAYAYVRNNAPNLSDPLGLFAIEKNIGVTRSLDIDFACPSNNGGACTIRVRARVECNCHCNGEDIKANPTLVITGQMYVSSGLWPYKGRHPVDKSVVDAQSAIGHEWNVHLNPAIAGVSSAVSNLENKNFTSVGECQSDCQKTSDCVGHLFGAILHDTQSADLPPKN
jgi:RHS repeat-associated protein